MRPPQTSQKIKPVSRYFVGVFRRVSRSGSRRTDRTWSQVWRSIACPQDAGVRRFPDEAPSWLTDGSRLDRSGARDAVSAVSGGRL